ncbi:GH92 family glycosyl hydrolase [Arcicella sp. LKC2W]|uniref:GH92 family glycosyl hydrolase n=1 Tax=Arcicella sp. LKC2W TaxID=2984198 RepID=UPI002B1EF59A|nr:GH92 family glycosyl hydrolase [Arcicella sp. LKC2W]MEA5457679.1 GH92 family glycosyl hydrolase [Arcicella sp. LKC2W]
MKKILTSSLVFLSVIAFGQTAKQENLLQYVNPLVGSDSRFDFSNGNTYPAIALPWGMNFWTPQTNKMGDGWCYQYASNKIRGFKQTHQPSPWINDYGAFSIFATTEKLVFDENKRESWFSHKAEISKPNYYRNYLSDYNTTVEITPTDRAARFRITYPQTEKAYLIIDGFFKNSMVKVFPKERKIVGYARNSSGGVPDNFKNYFVIYVDKDFEEVFGVKDGEIQVNVLEVESKHAGSIIRFKTKTDEQVNLKIASSFISAEQAELNLQNEIGNQTFDQIVEKGANTWNSQLNRIKVEGGSVDEMRTFYTALYHTMLFPRKFYEIGKDNKIVHYSPYNGKVESGYMFTDNGFWDTFRAVFPLFNLMFPEMNNQIMEGLANTYKEGGWLPEWASPGHRDCMVGSNSASIISDAYLKGVGRNNIETLYEAITKNTKNEGPLSSVGRLGAKYYNDLGYVPYDVGINENTARTLEYAYDDFTIWKLAKSLNKPQSEIDLYAKRAQNYRNVFDKSINFVRGKNKDGSFQSPFRPDKWGDAFTEGCSWHWTWCVFHDVQGLVDLMGGKKNFVSKLDSVFTAPPTFDYSYYSIQIHEITEMLVMNMGQYAHGNQPIQHMPYLYNYAGEPWKTQYHVRNIMKKLYSANPDGLCGDEDNGQTSAWYVFSALGMYPVAPATDQYVLGSPLFKKATISLQNGKTFTIVAPENNANNLYVSSSKLNNVGYTKNFLNYADVMKGGTLNLMMSSKPNKTKGVTDSDFPYSMTNELKK